MLCIRFRILYTVPSRLKKEEEYIKPEECIEFSHIPAPPTPALKHPAGLQSAEINISRILKIYISSLSMYQHISIFE